MPSEMRYCGNKSICKLLGGLEETNYGDTYDIRFLMPFLAGDKVVHITLDVAKPEYGNNINLISSAEATTIWNTGEVETKKLTTSSYGKEVEIGKTEIIVYENSKTFDKNEQCMEEICEIIEKWIFKAIKTGALYEDLLKIKDSFFSYSTRNTVIDMICRSAIMNDIDASVGELHTQYRKGTSEVFKELNRRINSDTIDFKKSLSVLVPKKL